VAARAAELRWFPPFLPTTIFADATVAVFSLLILYGFAAGSADTSATPLLDLGHAFSTTFAETPVTVPFVFSWANLTVKTFIVLPVALHDCVEAAGVVPLNESTELLSTHWPLRSLPNCGRSWGYYVVLRCRWNVGISQSLVYSFRASGDSMSEMLGCFLVLRRMCGLWYCSNAVHLERRVSTNVPGVGLLLEI